VPRWYQHADGTRCILIGDTWFVQHKSARGPKRFVEMQECPDCNAWANDVFKTFLCPKCNNHPEAAKHAFWCRLRWTKEK